MIRDWPCIIVAGCLFGLMFWALSYVALDKIVLGLGWISTVLLVWLFCYAVSWWTLAWLRDEL